MTDPERRELVIHFAEGGECEEIMVASLASNAYRLEETPLLLETAPELYWGDIIELEVLGNGQYRYVRVIKREYTHHSWLLDDTILNSPHLDEFLAAVMATGGNWERILGGMLIVHIPHTSNFDAVAELARRWKAASPT